MKKQRNQQGEMVNNKTANNTNKQTKEKKMKKEKKFQVQEQ
jgi:hypothetical protein